MPQYCSEDLVISLYDAANRVSKEYGLDVARSVFQRYGSSSVDDLNPSYYEAVFSDLYLIASDN